MTLARVTGAVRPETVAGWVGAAVTVLLVYVLVVRGGGLVIGRTDSPTLALSVLATGVVAYTAGPVRARVEHLAARLLRRPERAPYEVLAQFSREVTRSESLDQMPAVIARVLAQGTGVSWAQVWLLVHGQLTLVATYPADAVADTDPPALHDGRHDGRPGNGLRHVTVAHAGRPLGMLRLKEPEGRTLTPVEERLVGGLAAQAGLVLQTAQLRVELAQTLARLSAHEQELRRSRNALVTTQDLERRRLERDLHDGAQQQLVALAINLKLARAVVSTDPVSALTVVDEQILATADAMRTLSDLSRGLLPAVLSESGLAAAIAAATASDPLPVHVEAPDIGRFPTAVEATLYFCCLEALQNAAKHSGASRVDVRLRKEGDRLVLSVEDDGAGLRPDTTDGTGLTNLRERMVALNGDLSLHSRPGGGTAVTATVPSGSWSPVGTS
jgi:signal transduction histidine kinase